MARLIAPADPAPKPPTYRAPALACDTHCHLFGPADRFPYAAMRPYTPPDAPLSALRALPAGIGVERAVVVNATPYACDTSVVLDAISESGGRYRGIGNVDERMSRGDLETLASGAEQPGFQRLLALVSGDDKCWVKITGPERISRTGPPFHDAVPYARRLLVANPARLFRFEP